MTRPALLLAGFLTLAAWAGAQGPAPVLPIDVQLRMHRENRVLVGDLVRQSLTLANADDAVGRAEECEKTVRALAAALRRAAESQNADRAAELGDHLEAVVREGLLPNLDDAARTIDPSSPEYARLKVVRERTAGGLDELRDAIPTTGPLGTNSKLQSLRDKLAAFKDQAKPK